MDYSTLADIYEKLESVASKLAKTDILAELLKETSSNDLEKVVLLLQGRVFPTYSEFDLGVATQMVIKAISKATGIKNDSIEELFKKTGDLGLSVEKAIGKKQQATLSKKKLTIDHVSENLQKLATITGEGSQDRKLNLISELIVSASQKEARYIIRTILQDLRVGVAEGIIRDSIVKAFLLGKEHSKEEKEKASEAVDYAWNVIADFGEVARLAKEKGIKGLKKVRMQIGRPFNVMLGEKAESIEEIVKDFGKVAAEFKYDGMRAIIQKKGDKVWVFTRRLENVTKQFPDLVKVVKEGVKADEFIVEGEALGIDRKTHMPLPFQVLSQRIQRKYEIDKAIEEIPVQLNLFDIIYLDGKMLIDKPFKERRKVLEKIVKNIPGKLQLSRQIITDNVKELEKFYKEALDARQEGLMLKVLDTLYTFGRHVGTMYKIKSTLEPLDAIIIGATWGEGARTSWLTSFLLAVKDEETGKLVECGMASTGFSEAEFDQITKLLKPLIMHEKGKAVEVKPKIIIEVGYQEIQKSTNYSSGYALRFPTFNRFRYMEKSEPDTLERLKRLYNSQGRAG